MPDQAIVVLILAAIALVMTLVIMNANTVIRIRRPRPDQERAYLSEPLPGEPRRRRVVRTVRRVRPRRAASRSVVQSSANEYFANPDPRYTGPPPVDPWYARGWRTRMRPQAGVSVPLPVEEVVEEAPVDGDDGTGTEGPTGVPEPRVEQHTEVVEEHDRLI